MRYDCYSMIANRYPIIPDCTIILNDTSPKAARFTRQYAKQSESLRVTAFSDFENSNQNPPKSKVPRYINNS